MIAPDGRGVRRLVANAQQGAVSLDGRQIAFVRAGAIWAMQRDGSGQRQLTHPPKASGQATEDDHPAWSPDGRLVYFTRTMLPYGPGPLFSVRAADGSGLRRLTRPSYSEEFMDEGTCHIEAAPSPDGRLVVYRSVGACVHGVPQSIEAVTSAGRPAKLPFALPDTSAHYDDFYSSPAWTPTGDALAYSLTRSTEHGWASALYVSSTDGSKPRRIAHRRLIPKGDIPHGINGVAWSPDGAWLVLVREEKAGTWLVRRDGTGLRRITHTNTDDSDPAWLPRAR